MSQKRFEYYLNLLESLYTTCISEQSKAEFEDTSLSLCTKAHADLFLFPSEYMALCKRRAELVIKYGKE